MGADTPWPDYGHGLYLVEALQAMGKTRAQSMGGVRAVDWPEITAFNAACGPYERWEMQMLREMSLAFVEGLSLGENPMARPPIDQDV